MAATISIPPGFPDATTTGVPAGTVLTAYTGPTTITKAGTVIEGKIIDGGLVINAPNVTIINCVVKNGYWWGIDGEHGGSTLVVQNCDIIGTGIEGNSGILGTGKFIGNDISGYENGIMTTGGSGGVISGNYIHDITSSKPDAHYTGIQVEGGESNLRIENNTVMNERDSNIFLQALYGPISNVVINNNYVGGSNNGNNSYNIYVESRFGYPVTDVTVTNNYINKGYYGYFSIVNSSPTMSGNVLFDTDHGILPPTGTPTGPAAPTSPSAPSGNSNFDGGPGNDKFSFKFKLTDATVSFSGNHVIVDGPSGSHTVLTGFKTYVFTDGTVNNKDGDPLVDDLFYYSHNHDVWNARVDADQHYHQSGWHEGRDPNAFFSTSFYLSLNQDVKQAGTDPLAHFDQFGWREGRQPSAAFDDAAYLAANPDVAAAHVDPLAHFLQFGQDEGRQPTALTSLIGPHGFDSVYYLQHNPDVQAAEVNPFQHYQNFGWKEGRDPNALFDTNGYLAANPDVANAHINPLDHYDQFGWREGRDPSPGFDTTEYLSHYSDVAAAHVDPLVHYLQHGIDEGRQTFSHAILGSTGNDILKSTTSSESFLGNGGRDTFVFVANFGNDIIRDFGALGQSQDVLQFSKSVFDSFASVLSHASQLGQDVVISAGSDTLLLKNTTLGALDSPDFRFA